MKALSLNFLELIIESAQRGRKFIADSEYKAIYAFIEENFNTLAISLSLLLAAEWIAVAILARS